MKYRKINPHLPWAAGMLFLAGALLLRALSRQVPGFADRWRSAANPLLVGTLGRLSGLLPFSVEELMILLLVPFLLLLYRKRRLLRGGFCFFSLLFLLFEMNEDVYFQCRSFAELAGIPTGSYSTEELLEVCESLTDEVNRLAPLQERDARGLMVCGPDTGGRLRARMKVLGERWSVLAGFYPPPKPILFSRVLSLCSFTGFYSMIPVEANYNREMPPYNIPFTLGHELSHLKGITSEQEANYLGYLSCITAEDPDLRYSGAMLGWIYCTNELLLRDKEAHRAIRKQVCPEASLDLDFNTAFWDQYEGDVSETAESLNDSFLKSSGLSDGVRSYDLVVDLIVRTWHDVRISE